MYRKRPTKSGGHCIALPLQEAEAVEVLDIVDGDGLLPLEAGVRGSSILAERDAGSDSTSLSRGRGKKGGRNGGDKGGSNGDAGNDLLERAVLEA